MRIYDIALQSLAANRSAGRAARGIHAANWPTVIGRFQAPKKKPRRCSASGMRGERYRIRPRHAGATQHRVGGAGAGGVVRVASTGGD
jgi:hypothetical protein